MKLVKCDFDHCSKCVYRMKFGSVGESGVTPSNIACNYRALEGHSRIFENGQRKDIPNGYCDKFKEGESIAKGRGWTSDDMTMRSQRHLKTGVRI